MILRNENELLTIYQLNLSELFQMNSTMKKMPRTKQSHRRHSTSSSSSFTKFVARLQHTFSSKNLKSSTPIIQQAVFKPKDPPSSKVIH